MKEKSIDSLDEILNFKVYSNYLIHSWLITLTVLGFTLVPFFFLLDIITIPRNSLELLPRFGFYRFATTVIIILQFLIIRKTKPGIYSFLHGYVFTFTVSFAIVLMTMHLGGFDSRYYAGLNLVIIAVNLLLPWRAFHSALNGMITVCFYLAINFIWGENYQSINLFNNLFFMISTVIIASSINHVKYNLIQKEFESRQDLKKARDALWSEMEIAKKIQTALLPDDKSLEGYEIAARMITADEVGGDYFDIITKKGRKWALIGDVSGHGVDSGLIMMMTQTSVHSILNQNPDCLPSEVIGKINFVLKENIARLGVDMYITICALLLDEDKVLHSGHHQDIFVYRAEKKEVESIKTKGTWIGLLDNIEPFLKNSEFALSTGDVVLLYTDGVTETMNGKREMYGEERLKKMIQTFGEDEPELILDKIIEDVKEFENEQSDDISLLVIKKK